MFLIKWSVISFIKCQKIVTNIRNFLKPNVISSNIFIVWPITKRLKKPKNSDISVAETYESQNVFLKKRKSKSVIKAVDE